MCEVTLDIDVTEEKLVLGKLPLHTRVTVTLPDSESLVDLPIA